MNVILSIHPKLAKLIYEGKKTIEWRKSHPLNYIPGNTKVYLYETAPIKKITGFFYLKSVGVYTKKFFGLESSEEFIKYGCVSKDDLIKYQGQSDCLYTWIIDRPTRLYQNYNITEFNIKRPPQSWCYTKRKITTLKRYREDKNKEDS